MSLDEKLDKAAPLEAHARKEWGKMLGNSTVLSVLRNIRDTREAMLRQVGGMDFLSEEGKLKAMQIQSQAKGISHTLALLEELGQEKDDE